MLSLSKKAARKRTSITGDVRGKNPKFNWLDWNETELKGTFITYPERESVPENIKEQLIVELVFEIILIGKRAIRKFSESTGFPQHLRVYEFTGEILNLN